MTWLIPLKKICMSELFDCKQLVLIYARNVRFRIPGINKFEKFRFIARMRNYTAFFGS